ncbi:MAG: bifunctional methylenetetrahydrofolate dehydrogenase/methenyltetrahydrofolate cyclohydrolase FolD [Clostridia bacterium]|nr:bifunctional methylenetetrahydrofolate dehydrogenase/methenyltetrahydrofolate cyclohydrolase FolD [Clostridia bacterium]
MAIIIDGKATSLAMKEELKGKIDAFISQTGVTPGLAVIIVGNNPASAVYVRNKENACAAVGIHSETFRLAEETTEEELLALVRKLNADEAIHGILVQLPLPSHISEEKVIASISPKKDVDAFHAENVGHIMIGNYHFLPCTPAGVMALLERYGIEVAGKHCVVIGRSNIVGKPQAMLLLEKNGTVTVCHSKTKNLADITRQADILVAAVGRARFVRADMVKDGAVVIDVGINRLADGTLCGDVDFEAVKEKAYAITPVPGGVGPMTVTMLLYNTLTAAKESLK